MVQCVAAEERGLITSAAHVQSGQGNPSMVSVAPGGGQPQHASLTAVAAAQQLHGLPKDSLFNLRDSIED